jgi:hypothetical protein
LVNQFKEELISYIDNNPFPFRLFNIIFSSQIITAGSEACVRHWSINGSPMAVIPSGHQHAFSLKFNFNNHQYEVNHIIQWLI